MVGKLNYDRWSGGEGLEISSSSVVVARCFACFQPRWQEVSKPGARGSVQRFDWLMGETCEASFWIDPSTTPFTSKTCTYAMILPYCNRNFTSKKLFQCTENKTSVPPSKISKNKEHRTLLLLFSRRHHLRMMMIAFSIFSGSHSR